MVAVQKHYVSRILGVCLLALGIQHEMRIRCIILWTGACLALPYLSPLSHKRHDFSAAGGGGVIEHNMFVWTFPITFVWNVSQV